MSFSGEINVSDEDDLAASDANADIEKALRKALKGKAAEVHPSKDALKKIKAKIEKRKK
jgi:hypothetical protein